MPPPVQGSPDSLVVDKFREPPETVDPLLVLILKWRRPHNSKPEAAFHNWLVAHLKGLGNCEVSISVLDNIVVHVGKSKTLFSCHIDTVDVWKEGEPQQQQVAYDSNFGDILLDPAHKMTNGCCLGADDGVGVWIMLKMIEAKVPGVYVFHRGEEKGGIGAAAMRAERREFLKGFDRAIAFDRPGCHEVITVQGGQQCASETFGKQLAKALNDQDELFKYDTSDRGMFTDVKLYRDVIPECVNLGVGYTSQHTQGESLDYAHALALKEACLKVKWEELKPSRDPAPPVVKPHWDKGPHWATSHNSSGYKGQAKVPPKAFKPRRADLDDLLEMHYDDISLMIQEEPEQTESAMILLIAEVSALKARCSTLQNLLGV